MIFCHGYLGFGSPRGGMPYWELTEAHGEMYTTSALLRLLLKKSVSCRHSFLDETIAPYSSVSIRMQRGRDLAAEINLSGSQVLMVAHSMGSDLAIGMAEYWRTQGTDVQMLIINPWKNPFDGSLAPRDIILSCENDWFSHRFGSDPKQNRAKYWSYQSVAPVWRRHKELIRSLVLPEGLALFLKHHLIV